MQARRGVTVIELMAAVVVLMVVLVAVGTFMTASFRATQKDKDRTFAMQKAVQMMEEVLAHAKRHPDDLALGVDVLADEEDAYSFKLTTDAKVTDDQAGYLTPLSGNFRQNLGYRFVRHISVELMPEDDRARQVTIGVFYGDGQADPGKKADARPLATLTNVVKATRTTTPSTQVYDLFLINIENLPGWWAEPETLERMVDESVAELQKANQGLKFRKHWIRRLGYGRDPYYQPTINLAASYTEAGAVPLDSVYTYLGFGPEGWHCRPPIMRGQMRVDGGPTNTLSHLNTEAGYNERQSSYAYADQFNHALRLPEELEKHALTGATEPTLRMLLEELLSGQRRNALVLNLHSELFPMPPLRNYADAARLPAVKGGDVSKLESQWGLDLVANPVNVPQAAEGAHARLVTHPRRLEYNAADTVELWVYPFRTNPGGAAIPDAYRQAQIVLRAADAGGLAPAIDTTLHGGAVRDNVEVLVLDEADYTWKQAWPTGPGSAYMGVDEVEPVLAAAPARGLEAGDLVVHLKDIPYDHAKADNTRGLGTARLHGLNYFPGTGIGDLTGAPGPHNTARFKLRFKLTSAKVVQAITTIGANADLAQHQFPNRSTTYVWAGLAAPPTEKFQFVGDPRHSPYVPDDAANPSYNRYFGQLAGMAPTRKGWESVAGDDANPVDRNDIDIPRYFGLWRQALGQANALLAMPAGLSFGYVGLGGELATSGAGMSQRPIDGSASVAPVDTLAGVSRLVAKKDDSWYAKPWLGELVPDDEEDWSNWLDNGNLPSSDYHLLAPMQIVKWPAELKFNRTHHVGHKGAAAFFNGGAGAGDWIAHELQAGANATLTSDGTGLKNAFSLKLPAGAPFQFPFALNTSDVAQRPPDWADFAPYTRLEYGASPGGYYDVGGRRGFAPLLFKDGARTGYAVLSGASGIGDVGTALAGPLTLAGTLQGFFDLANPAYLGGGDKGAQTIQLLPQVAITKPAEDTRLTTGTDTIEWTSEWKRWDGFDYSAEYVDYGSDADAPPIAYNLKISDNGGVSWSFPDGTAAVAGLYDPSQSFTGLTYNWNYGALSDGEVVVRLEAYRTCANCTDTHYAYHQVIYKIDQ